MTKPTNERLATVEQQMTDLADKVDDIALDIKELKKIIQTKIIEHGDMKHSWFDTRLAKMEISSNLWRWLNPTLAAIAGSIMTFLIIEYLKHK